MYKKRGTKSLKKPPNSVWGIPFCPTTPQDEPNNKIASRRGKKNTDAMSGLLFIFTVTRVFFFAMNNKST